MEQPPFGGKEDTTYMEGKNKSKSECNSSIHELESNKILTRPKQESKYIESLLVEPRARLW